MLEIDIINMEAGLTSSAFLASASALSNHAIVSLYSDRYSREKRMLVPEIMALKDQQSNSMNVLAANAVRKSQAALEIAELFHVILVNTAIEELQMKLQHQMNVHFLDIHKKIRNFNLIESGVNYSGVSRDQMIQRAGLRNTPLASDKLSKRYDMSKFIYLMTRHIMINLHNDIIMAEMERQGVSKVKILDADTNHRNHKRILEFEEYLDQKEFIFHPNTQSLAFFP